MNETTFQGSGSIAYIPVVVNAKPKPITNADSIRSMTDEELADELLEWCGVFRAVKWSKEMILDWLEEASE